MEEVQQVKQKNNFHTLCLLLNERFKFTNKQSEKKAHEIIQRGINQFEIENQNIRLNGKERKYLIDELYSLIISKLNGDVDSFEDLQIYIYTRDFEEMTASVLGSFHQGETIPLPAKTKSKISEAQKRAYLKYIHSVKGQEALKRYRQSAKGKLTIGKAVKKYQQTALGKEAVKRAYLKYSQSDRGREKRREAVRAYRQRQRDKSILATGGTNLMSNNEEPKRETAKEISEKLVSNFISSKTREELDRYTKNYMEQIKKECEEI